MTTNKKLRIHIKTYGCAHNMSDSETMAHFLIKEGFEVSGISNEDKESVVGDQGTKKEEELMKEADLIIFNTCTVKNPSEDKFFSALKKTDKPTIIAGCIAQSERNQEWIKEFSAIGVNNLDDIVEISKERIKGNIIQRFNKTRIERDFIPNIRKNPQIAIIPILQGCLGNCTYCKTKFARGHLKSYPIKNIIKQIRTAKHEGVKEIWLVSEDNGAYGLDIGTTFIELLEEIIRLGEGPRIRIGMFNPEYAYKYRYELAKIFQNKIFYKFAHIPIQAGSDEVLNKMKRPYTVKEFKESIEIIKEKNPEMNFATDIICGFPTETKDDFEKTMSLVKQIEFSMINISKFYPRSGTLAAKMKLLPTKEVKTRSKEISDWFSKQNYNKKYLGKTISVIVNEEGKNNTLIGRTNNYRQVIITNVDDENEKKELLKSKKEVEVIIKETTRDDLRGELIKK